MLGRWIAVAAGLLLGTGHAATVPDFADVAERVAPTAVHVRARKVRTLSPGLETLFRDLDLPVPAPPDDPGVALPSSGSGVIVRPDGLVLTNHHVVDGAVDITVTLYDRREYPASVVGSDARTDVALLQVEGEGPFPAAAIGDSDALRVGEWVLAVGHPFEFQFSVSAGIVSARGRRNLAPDEIQDYIQTDAAVNPGSSGGPLFNLRGEVVGINTAIFSPPGAPARSAGIAFAIPVRMAWRVATELLETGRVARAAIGVVAQDSPATAEDPRPGAEITRVVPGGPAERAGLLRGDVIVAANGEPVSSAADLRGIVLAGGVGVPLRLEVERGAGQEAVEVVTVDAVALGGMDLPVPPDAVRWAGLALVEATPERLAPLGLWLEPDETPGMLVLEVASGSPGAVAGLEAGDRVVEVGGEPVADLAGFLATVADDPVPVLTLARDGTRFHAAPVVRPDAPAGG